MNKRVTETLGVKIKWGGRLIERPADPHENPQKGEGHPKRKEDPVPPGMR